MEERDLQFEIRLLERRLASLTVVAVVAGVLAFGGLAWAFGLQRQEGRGHTRLDSMSATVDSLGRAARADTARLAPVEEGLASLDALGRTLRTKADRRDMAAVSGQLNDLWGRLARNDSLITVLEKDLGARARELSVAENDSLDAVRRQLSAELDSMRTIHERQGQRLAALDTRIEALAESQQRSGRWRAANGAITVLNSGMILSHILDHSGR